MHICIKQNSLISRLIKAVGISKCSHFNYSPGNLIGRTTASMKVRQILLISSSKVHGYEYLECNADDINIFLRKNNISSVLFVPYALKDHDRYLSIVKEPFLKLGYKIESIHQLENPIHAIEKAEALFIGGGNTFLLLHTLYKLKIIDIIRKRVLKDGMPYIGCSAGTNVATKSIHTTNDMPIIYPPSFDALRLVPFNINPHYVDPDPSSTHKGETREERILQYLEQENSHPVVGLREGSCLLIDGNTAILKGIDKARLFMPGAEPKEIEPESDLSFLLTDQTCCNLK